MKRAIEFEYFLEKNGYVQHLYSRKENKYVPSDVDSYSSLGIISTYYIKGDNIISCGVWEKGYPPTLITRPNGVAMIVTDNKWYSLSTNERDISDMMFEQYTNEQILDAIENNKNLTIELSEEYKENFLNKVKDKYSLA